MFHKKIDVYKHQLPHKVKTQEEGRVNPCYTNITRGDVFEPVEGIPYIWTYTTKNELIVGIEKPWEYPQAFNHTNSSTTWEKISNSLKAAGPLGHPTLSAEFEKNGNALPDKGQAYVGGEIILLDGTLILNNTSGRFGRTVKNDPIDVLYLMNEIKNHFEKATNIKTKIKIKLMHATYLQSYYEIWEKYDNEINSALHLLDNYLENIDISCLNGEKLTKELLSSTSSKNTISNIIEHYHPHLNNIHDEELKNRIKFIAGQTNYVNDITISPAPRNDTSTNATGTHVNDKFYKQNTRFTFFVGAAVFVLGVGIYSVASNNFRIK